MPNTKPLSVSGLRLKAILAAGEDSQSALAEYLRCDQTTVSKWLGNGATPTLAMAVRIEERWPEVTARGWLDMAIDLGRRGQYGPRETKGVGRGKLGKTGGGRGGP